MVDPDEDGTRETDDAREGALPSRAPRRTRSSRASRAIGARARRARGRRGTGGERAPRSRAAVVLLVMLLAVALSGAGYAAMKFFTREAVLTLKLLHEFGGCGKNDGQFDEPRDLAVDPQGNILVVDMRNYRIQRFAPDGRFLAKFGRQGAGPGEFNDPTGIAVDPKGNLYVADMGNSRIQKLDAKGRFVSEWKGDRYRWYGPREVASDADGFVYVADTGNGTIVKVSPDGEVLRRFGGFGDKKGRFNNPIGVSVDASGNVYVADTCNRRVQQLDREGKVAFVTGTIRSWPRRVPVPLCEPYVAVSRRTGLWYVTDPTARPAGGRGEGAIRVYDSTGEFLGRAERPQAGRNFAKPMGVDVDADGNVWVVNHDSCSVQKFAPVD